MAVADFVLVVDVVARNFAMEATIAIIDISQLAITDSNRILQMLPCFFRRVPLQVYFSAFRNLACR